MQQCLLEKDSTVEDSRLLHGMLLIYAQVLKSYYHAFMYCGCDRQYAFLHNTTHIFDSKFNQTDLFQVLPYKRSAIKGAGYPQQNHFNVQLAH